MISPARRKSFYTMAIPVLLLIAVFFLAYPGYVIRPFRHQGVKELQVALFALQYQRVVGLLCTAAALIAFALYLRTGPRTRLRTAGSAGLVLLCAVCAGLSRINIYERMFHPAGSPSFEPALQTQLDADEKVLAVTMKNDARAYTVRSLAYHHIVNDVVGGVPIVATY